MLVTIRYNLKETYLKLYNNNLLTTFNMLVSQLFDTTLLNDIIVILTRFLLKVRFKKDFQGRPNFK